MKKIIYSYLLIAISATFILSCEDDDPIELGDDDPRNETIVNLEATISTNQPNAGEGNLLPFSITVPQTFASDATVTARVTLDNGTFSTGTAVVPAGSNSGDGFITMPADDGDPTEGLLSENAGSFEAIAILLDEIVPGTQFEISSNSVDINIWSDTATVDGGLGLIMDWTDSANVDLDLSIDELDGATDVVDAGVSGSRFEDVFFGNNETQDGEFLVRVEVFAAVGNDVDYVINFTLPNNELVSIAGTFPALNGGETFVPARFVRTTDIASGDISYEVFPN